MFSFTVEKRTYEALNDWLLTPLGKNVSFAFNDVFHEKNDLQQGQTLLQLGDCADQYFFLHDLYKDIIKVSPFSTPKANIVTSLFQLPLDKASVDCVFLPYTMEAFLCNLNILDEVDRVLKPMGYLLFLSINPYSFWGLWLKHSRNTCFGSYSRKAMSILSLKRALIHRGYRQVDYQKFYYTPPINHGEVINKVAFLNKLPPILSLWPNGFYCYIVQKYHKKALPLEISPILISFS